ncbi:MAG: hypothetical protein WD448_01850 [Woeseia sp.]
MDWLQNNAPLVSAAASVGMFVVWTFYAWLFYDGFRRQRAAQLVIHEAGGGRTGSTCLLVNLGQEPVHVLCSMAFRDGAGARLHDTSGGEDLPAIEQAKQGPLQVGASLTLGSFEGICRQLDDVARPPAQDDGGYLVEVCVAAVHGYTEWPIGARRRFSVDLSSSRVVPTSHMTEQLRSRRSASEVQSWVDECHDRR